MSSDQEDFSSEAPEEEEVLSSSSEDEGDTDRSFGEQYNFFLQAQIPKGKCPILSLSKIPGKIDRQKQTENQKEKETTRLHQAKKVLLNKKHCSLADFDAKVEKDMLKTAQRESIKQFTILVRGSASQMTTQNQSTLPTAPPELEEEDKNEGQNDDVLSLLRASVLGAQ